MTGFLVFVGVVVALGLAVLLLDWAGARRQERRLRGGLGRDDVDERQVRNDRIINASYASFTARSTRDRGKP